MKLYQERDAGERAVPSEGHASLPRSIPPWAERRDHLLQGLYSGQETTIQGIMPWWAATPF
ncbi:MAG: hypothetical protein ACLU38_07155 [Dysosmobacter sp.]